MFFLHGEDVSDDLKLNAYWIGIRIVHWTNEIVQLITLFLIIGKNKQKSRWRIICSTIVENKSEN